MYLMRLVYYSRIVLDGQSRAVFKEIKQLLRHEAMLHHRMGITGGVLFNQTYFAQIIEGDRKAVTDTFIRASEDPRHTDLIVLEALPVDERWFTSWNIGFAGATDNVSKLYLKYGTGHDFNPAAMTARSLMGFIREVVTERNMADKVVGDLSEMS